MVVDNDKLAVEVFVGPCTLGSMTLEPGAINVRVQNAENTDQAIRVIKNSLEAARA